MENTDLIELRKQLAYLPVMQDKLPILQGKVKEAEDAVNKLLERYRAESMDVERLEKDSLRTLLLKNFGRYEEKLDKESEEMLAAKLEYDKACMRLKELEAARRETSDRIAQLLAKKSEYEEELKKREEAVKAGLNSGIALEYKGLETEQELLVKRLAETEEAERAARRALSTADNALEHLKSAQNWATFDVWTRGGIISHMAKYQHIDQAEEDFHRLTSQMEDLRKELRDINPEAGVPGMGGIDSTTRTIDFWFDNIFTDWNVRDRIGEDYDRMSGLRDKISGIVYKLGNDGAEIQSKLKELDQRKRDLLVDGGGE